MKTVYDVIQNYIKSEKYFAEITEELKVIKAKINSGEISEKEAHNLRVNIIEKLMKEL